MFGLRGSNNLKLSKTKVGITFAQSINQSINQNNHSERNSPAPRRNPKTEKIVNEALKRDFLAKGGSDEKDDYNYFHFNWMFWCY